jgi:hypothetical protein
MGNIINEHLSKQSRYSFNAEHWGVKILSINWKYIIQLWSVRNTEVHGDTKEKTEYIKRQEMIQEILYIQSTHTHLSMDERSLINRDINSLQGMNTSSITAYLYGAQMLVQSTKNMVQETNQPTITSFFQAQTAPTPANDSQNGLRTPEITI